MDTEGRIAPFLAIVAALIVYLWGYGTLLVARMNAPILPSALAADNGSIELSTENDLTLLSELPPILERVAACESTGDPNGTPRQFNSDGSILWGIDPKTDKPIKRDLGMFQINTWIWSDEAKELGDNLYTQQGNVAFALWLYNNYGLNPWFASSKCWSE